MDVPMEIIVLYMNRVSWRYQKRKATEINARLVDWDFENVQEIPSLHLNLWLSIVESFFKNQKSSAVKNPDASFTVFHFAAVLLEVAR